MTTSIWCWESLIAVGGLVTLKAQPDPNAPKVVEVEKVKDNLFVLRGANGGGNTAVFVMANGVAVVDSKNPGWGQPILAKIKELTPKPVTLLINTHTHGDHVSGNVAFAPSVDVVVQENTKTNMEKMPIFKENNNSRDGEAHLQGPDDHRQRRGPDRPLLLRPRPHQWRRVDRVPGASHRALGRHLRRQVRAADRRQ